MEVVLLENIKNLGNIGDIVNVKRGHGRNFLIKYGKALVASKTNIDLVNKKKSQLNEKNISLKKEAKKIYDIINKKSYKYSGCYSFGSASFNLLCKSKAVDKKF